MNEKEQKVYDALDALKISYERFEHDAAMTMEDCEAFDAGKNAAHCKNLFLTNRQGTLFYILLVVGDKPFKTKDVSKQLGVARLSFGTSEQLMEKLSLTPGSVTPMGLINDQERAVRVLIDRDVAQWEYVIVHPNVNTASIILKTEDLFKFFKARGNELTYVEVLPAPKEAP
ncbi:prolyl-tRNA synthetase associated domain-containing protein [Christensenellaceae bacterium OttesenSCG-928-M15]|nr:prolyl-tRNA synthetase associated domain-containing protein [Christensenellaceae bacterium OttesenSCG-928-M15]